MAAAEKQKVVARLQQRLQLEEAEAAELAERAEETFLSETGRAQVPGRAFWLWVDLALAVHRGNTGESSGQVTSIKRGDTTIQYAASAAATLPTGGVMDRVRAWAIAKAR